MVIYTTQTDTDTYHTLVTDEFHVLQQVRIQPPPCRCLMRTEDGPWEWVSRERAQRILASWQQATDPKQAA